MLLSFAELTRYSGHWRKGFKNLSIHIRRDGMGIPLPQRDAM
jgi:hypothetical protein